MKHPVLILGAVPRMTTPIARSLYRQGIEVDVVTFSKLEPPVRSRAVRNFWRIPDPDVSPSDFVEALCGLIRKHRHDMLIPSNDVGLTAIVEHYDSFKDLLHVGCPPPAIVGRVLDKDLTLETARQCGVRIPRSVVVSNSAALPEAARSLGFPIVLKPSEKKRSDEFKTCIIDSAHNLEMRFPKPRQFSPPMLAQEFCRGEGVGVEVLMHKREAVSVFQHRRLKELPCSGGVAVVAIAESPNPDLLQSSLVLLQALQWDGPAMVEFKVDPSNGTATLMEVNGRYWGSVSLHILAGLDFPLYQWKLLHDEAPNIPSTYVVGTKWRWTAGCLSRYHEMLLAARRPGPDRDLLLRNLMHLGEDFGFSTRDALFSPSDPLPAIVELLRTMKDLAVSDIRKIRSRLAPAHLRANDAAAVRTALPTNSGKADRGTAAATGSGRACQDDEWTEDRRR
jgi:predicted ATP-grasp superfamily ATP-dependent carboligase